MSNENTITATPTRSSFKERMRAEREARSKRARERREAKLEARREAAAAELRPLLPPGTTLFTTNDSVARSGLSAVIRVKVITNNQPQDISYRVAEALGWTLKRGGVEVSGCGMDRGFHLVHCLSYALHGFKTVGKAAKEAEGKGHPFKPTKRAFRPGYSLIHQWD